MNRRKFLSSGLVLLAGTGLASCYAPGYGPGHGPPPWAPAHGYRRKHPAGIDLVYDAGLGVYAVAGYPYYFYDDHFYRLRDGAWYISVALDGPWRQASPRALPSGLRKRGGGGPPGRGRGRGRGP